MVPRLRSLSIIKALFARADLTIIKEEKQKDFPPEIFAVYMYVASRELLGPCACMRICPTYANLPVFETHLRRFALEPKAPSA